MYSFQKIKFSFLCFILLIPGISLSTVATTINSIPASGIVIDTPGLYLFGKDIKWHPNGESEAILIIADNVTLDMQHCKLKSKKTPFNTSGIVARSVSNLIIKNGYVENMGLKGIDCETSSNILIKNMTVNKLTANNIIDYIVPVGILVTASRDVSIKNCTVKNIEVTSGSLAGIQLTETISSKVLNCVIKNLNNKDGASTGIGHLLCDIAKVKSCKLKNIKSEFKENLNTEGHTAIGIVPVLSTNLLIKNCNVSNITGCCDDAHGMSIFECAGAIVKHCKVKNVIDGVGAQKTGAKATGIEVYASLVKVLNCHVKDITAINPQDKQATGFAAAECVGVEFHHCKAENVNVYNEKGIPHRSLGNGTGFGWAPDPRPEFMLPAVGILYKKCTAKSCQVGFDAWFHIDSIWQDIFSDGNEISVLDQNQPPRTLSCDACSECGCTQVGCYPTPRVVRVDNIGTNNTFNNVKVKIKSD